MEITDANSCSGVSSSDAKQNMTSATLCEDLEQLLETGYAELIRTELDGVANNGEDNEEAGDAQMAIVLDDSPFPKGMKVFDDDADGDENSPFEDEAFDSGYEVICQREIVQIPVQATPTITPAGTSETILGQGASYMMGKATKLLGSFFTSGASA